VCSSDLEIINAFVTMDESLTISKANVDKKNQSTYAAFATGMKNDPKKFGPNNEASQNVKKAADSLGIYLESLKDMVIREADAKKAGEQTPKLREMEAKEDYDTPTRLMCGEANDGTGAKATDLKNKMVSFKNTLISNITDKDQQEVFKKELENLVDTRDPDPNSSEALEDGKRTWEMSKFYHNPTAATVAIMTKLQGDVKNAEAQIVDYLYSSVTSSVVAFDVLKAIVKPQSNYVLLGGEYTADVFIGASSSTLEPEVYIGATTNGNPGTECKGCNSKLNMDESTRIAKFVDRPGSEGKENGQE